MTHNNRKRGPDYNYGYDSETKIYGDVKLI